MKCKISTSEKIHVVFYNLKKIGLSLIALEQKSMIIDLKICFIHSHTTSRVYIHDVMKE